MASNPRSLVIAFCAKRAERILHCGERRAYRCLRAQNICSERNLRKAGRIRRGKFRVGPSTFRTDRDGDAGDIAISGAPAPQAQRLRAVASLLRARKAIISAAPPMPETLPVVSQHPANQECANAAPAARIRRGFASIVRRVSLPPRSDPSRCDPPRAARFPRRPVPSLFRSPTRTGQTSRWPEANRSAPWRPAPAAARQARIEFRPARRLRFAPAIRIARRSIRTIARAPRAARAPDGAPPRLAVLPIPLQILPQRIAAACAAMLYQSDGIARPAGLRLAVHRPFCVSARDSCFFLLSSTRRTSAATAFPAPSRRDCRHRRRRRRLDGHRVSFVPPRHSCGSHHHRQRRGACSGGQQEMCCACSRSPAETTFPFFSAGKARSSEPRNFPRSGAPQPTSFPESLFRSPSVPRIRATPRIFCSSAYWTRRTPCKSSRSARSQISRKCFPTLRARPGPGGNSLSSAALFAFPEI